MTYAINKTKYLAEDEGAELERVLNKFIDSDTRNCIMFFTLLYTGARASECLAIQKKDLSHGTVLIRGLKGSNDREVPLPPWLYDRLISLAPNVGRIFPVCYHRMQALWYRYRPVPKSLHCLRHTFAIRQLRKHGKLDVIMRLLGHRNIQNTMVYSTYAYNDDELRRIVL